VAVKRTTSVIDDGKIKKMRGEGCCGGWLLAERKRLRDWVTQESSVMILNFGISI
jgi:hypothetical protein